MSPATPAEPVAGPAASPAGPDAPQGDARVRRILRGVEVAAVLLVLAAALVPRLRDANGPWDREYEGFQGTFFALCALNYERLGVGAYGGYPALNVDLPTDPAVVPYLYPNHPPAVPLAAWVGAHAFAPADWNEAWRAGEPPPPGTERAVRLPFLFAHVLGLLALWFAVRCAGDPRRALLALALAAALPLSVLYATLVNYENLVWPPLLFGIAFQVRHLRSGALRDLGIAGACFFLGACVTFFPAFLVPPLALQAWWARGFRRGVLTGAVLSAGSLLPAALHGAWVRRSLPQQQASNVGERVQTMLGPLFDGEHPATEWLRRQAVRSEEFFTLPVLALAAAGLVLVLVRMARTPVDQRAARVSPAAPLFFGGALVLFTFYRHTWDGDHARNGQTVFLLNLAPGVVALAAEALGALGRPLLRLRGGEAPLVVLTLGFLLPALGRTEAIRRDWRAPGPNDVSTAASGPLAPLPSTVGTEVAELLPAGAVGIYPAEMGFNIAVSYYAWRTLIPATPATYDLALLRISESYGLGDAPRYILLPKDPPPYAAAAVAATRAAIEGDLELLAENETWELWPALAASPPRED